MPDLYAVPELVNTRLTALRSVLNTLLFGGAQAHKCLRCTLQRRSNHYVDLRLHSLKTVSGVWRAPGI